MDEAIHLSTYPGRDEIVLFKNGCYAHIVPVKRSEAFMALKLSSLESFRALKFIGQNGIFEGPKTLQIGES